MLTASVRRNSASIRATGLMCRPHTSIENLHFDRHWLRTWKKRPARRALQWAWIATPSLIIDAAH